MINNSTNHYCYQISFGLNLNDYKLNLNEYKQLLFGSNSKVALNPGLLVKFTPSKRKFWTFVKI